MFDPVSAIIGAVDSFIYTEQEQKRDELAQAKVVADAEIARASIENAKLKAAQASSNAESTKTLALYGLGAVGVIVLGVVAYMAFKKK